jgi:hypothetical protein
MDAIVCRHESLRTRVVAVEGNPRQVIDTNVEGVLEIADLTRTSRSNLPGEARRLVEELVQRPVDMAVGPLFGARLIVLADNDHVLVMAVDHVLADGMSMGLLSRDLFSTYGQLARGESSSLPQVKVQLADFAAWQQKQQASWIVRHGGYWRERLRGSWRAPSLSPAPADSASRSWRKHDFRLEGKLRAALRDLAASERTTLPMILLAAYSAVLMRRFEKTEIVLGLLTNGRPYAELSNTVGFFTFTLYLRLELHPTNTFVDLLHSVAMEHRTALEHQDFGFVSNPRNGLMRGHPPTFTWLSINTGRAVGTSDVKRSRGNAGNNMIGIKPFPFARGSAELQGHEDLTIHGGQPWLSLIDTGEDILGTIRYQSSRFAGDEVSRLGRALRAFSSNCAARPRAAVSQLL